MTTLLYDDFKAFVIANNLYSRVYFAESATQYFIWLTLDGAVVNTGGGLDKGGPEANDFDATLKPLVRLNRPVAADGTPYVRGTEKTVGKTMKFDGYKFNAPAGVNTKYQKRITPVLIELVGAYCRVKGGNDDDKLQFRIVDVDNVLGYGAGLVLAHVGRDIAKIALEELVTVESESALDVAANLYLEIEYQNTGATAAQVAGAFKYFS